MPGFVQRGNHMGQPPPPPGLCASFTIRAWAGTELVVFGERAGPRHYSGLQSEVDYFFSCHNGTVPSKSHVTPGHNVKGQSCRTPPLLQVHMQGQDVKGAAMQNPPPFPGFMCQGKMQRGIPPPQNAPFPGVMHQGKDEEGQLRGSHTPLGFACKGENCEGAAVWKHPPSPGFAHQGEM
ncbi:hypothetical protein EDB92DRAFT_1818697 [Lactarius akahatsu]|uniref:Uncharacterized protein n=1 Tax=Lactarius akahatsu TaxID=416441 RepID=A0AAD4QAR3_9AGAM|nr:hypothetical protein EDB92DRAFT_1818697 [Lactarius akahatsu]